MFSKLAVAVLATLAVFVAAAPASAGDINGSCNSGQVYCCDSTTDIKPHSDESKILAKMGFIGVISKTTTIGQGCKNTPTCSQTSVCCDGNNFNGLVVIGCSPIDIQL